MKIQHVVLLVIGLGALFVAPYLTPEKSMLSPEALISADEMAPNLQSNESEAVSAALLKSWNKWDQSQGLLMANGANQVTSIGPETIGGRTRAILVDQANSNRYFVGAVSGGLWRSDDAGATWTALDESLSAGLTITSITQSPFNASHIYYTTGEVIDNGINISGMGVFRSTDGGLSFEHVETPQGISLRDTWRIAHSRSAAMTVYVVSNDNGLFRLKTTNGVDSWEKVLDSNNLIAYDVICHNNFVMVTTNKGVYKSNTGDTGTFQLVNQGVFPASTNRSVIANSPDSDVIYIAFSQGGFLSQLFRSVDAGDNWEEETNLPSVSTNAGYNFMIGIKGDGPDSLVLGGVHSHVSTDGGNSWLPIAISHPDYHAFATIPNNSNQVLIGNDGGVYRYDWSSITSNFVDLNEGYISTQFYHGYYAANGLAAIGGTQDNGTLNMGSIYPKEWGGDGYSSYIAQEIPGLAYFSYQNGQIFRKTTYPSGNVANCNPFDVNAECYITNIHSNAGEPSSQVIMHTYFEVNPANENQLFARSFNKIWKYDWVNGSGYSVVALGPNSSTETIACEVSDNPTVYYGGGGGSLFRIDNAGTANSEVAVNLSASSPHIHAIGAIEILPNDPSTIFVGYKSANSTDRIYRVDAADTDNPVWTSISSNLPISLPVRTIALDPDAPETNIYIGTSFGIYYTTNGGDSWQKEPAMPSVPVYELHMRNTDRTLFAFTHGRGAWAIELDAAAGGLTISGNIHRHEGTPVAQAEISLCGTTTADNGNYACSDLASGEDYTIEPYKNINVRNGVNTFDLALLWQHILGLQLLPSPYHIIAGDVNSSGTLTLLDYIKIRAVILHLEDEFPNTPSWKFVPEAYVFPTPLNPFQPPYPESIDLNNLTTDSPDNDFIGIKMGDVNNSANAQNIVDGGSETSFALNITDRAISAGERVEIPIQVSGFREKIGFQLALQVNTNYLEIVDFGNGDLNHSDRDFFYQDHQSLRTLWFEPTAAAPSSMRDGSSLFTLVVKANRDLRSLQEIITLDERTMENHAFDARGMAYPIALEIERREASPRSETGLALGLAKVYPNPFQATINITYPSPFTKGTLTLLKANGSLVQTINPNQTNLKLAHLPAGIYYLSFQSEEGTQIEKLVKQ